MVSLLECIYLFFGICALPFLVIGSCCIATLLIVLIVEVLKLAFALSVVLLFTCTTLAVFSILVVAKLAFTFYKEALLALSIFIIFWAVFLKL